MLPSVVMTRRTDRIGLDVKCVFSLLLSVFELVLSLLFSSLMMERPQCSQLPARPSPSKTNQFTRTSNGGLDLWRNQDHDERQTKQLH
ncbi:hypothetical protein VTJ04DRAFT_9801 [Mycothermus thermophilus]|uniref:uncharacterized protein n=1 Tax=Humicola insolens TaxID=85995 RepID=UPI00374331CA